MIILFFFFFLNSKTKFDGILTWSPLIYHRWQMYTFYSSNGKVLLFHDYNLCQPKYKAVKLVTLKVRDSWLFTWHKLSKTFVESFIFQSLLKPWKEHTIFPKLSKTFTNCKNPVPVCLHCRNVKVMWQSEFGPSVWEGAQAVRTLIWGAMTAGW